MSMPVDQQQQQPPSVTMTQESYHTHSGHGSVGPVVAVLAVIMILGVLAGLVGRLCYGRRIVGRSYYDIEGWVERKCSSCIDGRIGVPPPPSTNVSAGSAVSASSPTQETKQEGHSPRNPPANVDS